MIVGRCTAAGCNVLTIGPRCIEHDAPVTRTFTRGRPFAPSALSPAPARAYATPVAPVAPVDLLGSMRGPALVVRSAS